MVQRQVQEPEAEKHHAVAQRPHQRGSQAQSHPNETEQLHGGVRVQAELRSKPQQGGGGQQLLPQRFATVPQLPPRGQQPLVTIQTLKRTERHRAVSASARQDTDI